MKVLGLVVLALVCSAAVLALEEVKPGKKDKKKTKAKVVTIKPHMHNNGWADGHGRVVIVSRGDPRAYPVHRRTTRIESDFHIADEVVGDSGFALFSGDSAVDLLLHDGSFSHVIARWAASPERVQLRRMEMLRRTLLRFLTRHFDEFSLPRRTSRTYYDDVEPEAAALEADLLALLHSPKRFRNAFLELRDFVVAELPPKFASFGADPFRDGMSQAIPALLSVVARQPSGVAPQILLIQAIYEVDDALAVDRPAPLAQSGSGAAAASTALPGKPAVPTPVAAAAAAVAAGPAGAAAAAVRPILTATAGDNCAPKGGVCKDVSTCTTGNVQSGLCPGAANIKCCLPKVTPPVTPPVVANSLAGIQALAAASKCAKINWADRGLAPSAYIKTIATVYAKAVCRPNDADVKALSSPTKGSNDVLSLYSDIFTRTLGAQAFSGGANTLRAMYTLMIGLGMRESSGVHCTGRDLSASFTTGDSAEAGLFQTSWGSQRNSPLMAPLYTKYSASKVGCVAAPYAGRTCTPKNMQNWGTGTGPLWQALTKSCPAFATEFAAILLRVNGGPKGEWGPLRRKEAQVQVDCHTMLAQVENVVNTNPGICTSILTAA